MIFFFFSGSWQQTVQGNGFWERILIGRGLLSPHLLLASVPRPHHGKGEPRQVLQSPEFERWMGALKAQAARAEKRSTRAGAPEICTPTTSKCRWRNQRRWTTRKGAARVVPGSHRPGIVPIPAHKQANLEAHGGWAKDPTGCQFHLGQS